MELEHRCPFLRSSTFLENIYTQPSSSCKRSFLMIIHLQLIAASRSEVSNKNLVSRAVNILVDYNLQSLAMRLLIRNSVSSFTRRSNVSIICDSNRQSIAHRFADLKLPIAHWSLSFHLKFHTFRNFPGLETPLTNVSVCLYFILIIGNIQMLKAQVPKQTTTSMADCVPSHH